MKKLLLAGVLSAALVGAAAVSVLVNDQSSLSTTAASSAGAQGYPVDLPSDTPGDPKFPPGNKPAAPGPTDYTFPSEKAGEDEVRVVDGITLSTAAGRSGSGAGSAAGLVVTEEEQAWAQGEAEFGGSQAQTVLNEEPDLAAQQAAAAKAMLEGHASGYGVSVPTPPSPPTPPQAPERPEPGHGVPPVEKPEKVLPERPVPPVEQPEPCEDGNSRSCDLGKKVEETKNQTDDEVGNAVAKVERAKQHVQRLAEKAKGCAGKPTLAEQRDCLGELRQEIREYLQGELDAAEQLAWGVVNDARDLKNELSRQARENVSRLHAEAWAKVHEARGQVHDATEDALEALDGALDQVGATVACLGQGSKQSPSHEGPDNLDQVEERARCASQEGADLVGKAHDAADETLGKGIEEARKLSGEAGDTAEWAQESLHDEVDDWKEFLGVGGSKPRSP